MGGYLVLVKGGTPRKDDYGKAWLTAHEPAPQNSQGGVDPKISRFRVSKVLLPKDDVARPMQAQMQYMHG